MGEPQGFEHQLEHYLQGHFHPDVAPQVRREIQLDHVTAQTFLRLAGIFQANHEALDEGLVVPQDELPFDADNVILADFSKKDRS